MLVSTFCYFLFVVNVPQLSNSPLDIILFCGFGLTGSLLPNLFIKVKCSFPVTRKISSHRLAPKFVSFFHHTYTLFLPIIQKNGKWLFLKNPCSILELLPPAGLASLKVAELHLIHFVDVSSCYTSSL